MKAIFYFKISKYYKLSKKLITKKTKTVMIGQYNLWYAKYNLYIHHPPFLS